MSPDQTEERRVSVKKKIVGSSKGRKVKYLKCKILVVASWWWPDLCDIPCGADEDPS